MKRRTTARIFPAWLGAAALCCALLAGCGAAQPADSTAADGAASGAASTAGSADAAQSGAASAADSAQASAWQDDGKLRLLYETDYGSALAFCGVEPLYTPEGSESVSLLTDLVTGETTHYAANTPQDGEPYQYRVYDRTGTLVYYCGDEVPYHLAGDWLLLRSAGFAVDVYDTADTTYRAVNLTTGESKPLPGLLNAALGGYYATTYRAAEDGGEPLCTGYLLDEDLEQTACFEGVSLYQAYDPYSGDGRSAWVAMSRAVTTASCATVYQSGLCCPADGAVLEGFVEFVGEGLACLEADGGQYVLYDLNARAELAHGGQQYLLYHAGIQMTRERNGDLLRDNEGLTYLAEDYDLAADGTLVVRSANQTVTRVYGPDGKLLYSRQNVGGDRLEALTGGRFLATVYNWRQPERSFSTVYGPEGVLFQTEPGSYVNQRTDSYLVVTRLSYAGSYRYDIYDYEGSLLIESLAGLPGTPEEDILPARRGFTIGWMDLQGNWLWSQRVFRSVEDEKNYEWY